MRFPERRDSDDEGFHDYDDQADESAIDRYLLDKEYAYEPWNYQFNYQEPLSREQVRQTVCSILTKYGVTK